MIRNLVSRSHRYCRVLGTRFQLIQSVPFEILSTADPLHRVRFAPYPKSARPTHTPTLGRYINLHSSHVHASSNIVNSSSFSDDNLTLIPKNILGTTSLFVLHMTPMVNIGCL